MDVNVINIHICEGKVWLTEKSVERYVKTCAEKSLGVGVCLGTKIC